ncbi:MAG: PolC-type DNA polymerase III, partial [Fusobacteriota bacterium]
MKDKKYVKIKPKKGVLSSIGAEDTKVEHIHVYPERKTVELDCTLPNCIAIRELEKIEEGLNKRFGKGLKYEFNIDLEQTDITSKEFGIILDQIINKVKQDKAMARAYLSLYRHSIDKNKVVEIELKNKVAAKKMKEKKVHKVIEKKLLDILGDNFKVNFKFGDFSKDIERIDKIKLKEQIKNIPEPVKKKKKKIKAKNPDRIMGRKIKEDHMSFEEFNELYLGEVAVLVGKVFGLKSIETRTGKILWIFNITNFEDSLTIKSFVKKGDDVPVKEGMWVKIKGKKQQDNYNNNEDVIFTKQIMKVTVKENKRFDSEEQKRVELHTHTKMSDMDSVLDVGQLVDKAAKWGHKAVAITDHGVVHNFPFAYKAAKKHDDFKVILGTEGYFVDDTVSMVENVKKDELIEEATYVVFDLETTGFSPYEDKIIEIGAVKMKGPRLIERFSTFINPEREIPEIITELTGIDNSMVKGAPLIEEALNNFMDFVGDSILVAHNTDFDIGFITQKLKNMGKTYDNPYADTLLWSRNILTERKRHNLKTIAKHFRIALDNHHRAVDDAEATAKIFKNFLNIVISKGAKKLSDIDKEFKFNVLNARPKHISILVKNLKGLHNLYKIVSEAHINYFYSVPRIPKTLLEENKEGLIIGTGSEKGEVPDGYLRGKSEKDLKDMLKFYDYVEIQPDSNKKGLLKSGGLKNKEDIHKMNKKLIELGKSENKLVVASGDVHYLDPEDNLFRRVLVYGKKGPRSDYKINKELYFKTTKEMLDEFSYLGPDMAREIVIENTNKIADMIEKVQPVPSEFCPPKIEGAEEEVKEMTFSKAKELYGDPLPERIQKRLDRELDSIIGNGFAVLYLIAQKLVKKSLDDGYLVGSRGSVGSSLVAYMMDITEVNALYPHYRCPECKYSEFKDFEGCGVDLVDKDCPECGNKMIKDGHSIPFEVFMGFNGEKVPDIDLNFSGEYQSKVHRYTEELFGEENVFKAGTISTLATKNAFGYAKKYIEENELQKRSAEMLRIAKGCENARKTTGQHPGGMIVVPEDRSVYEFTPVQKPANDVNSTSITTHFDYHVMDEQLVKLDILGHDDPTTIKILQESTGVNIYDVPLADEETLKIFSGTEALGVTPEEIKSPVGTFGVPEFGTSFVRQMLVDTRPTTFAELARISGLSHGTDVWLNNAQDYIKNGKAELSEVISVRDDIMNYLIGKGVEKGTAFEIMEFVRKGKPSRMPEKWKEYEDIMKEKDVPKWYIESCQKIKYMFPKGHAVAYVMMAMRIAYFKVHYPLEFYAAFLTRKAGDFDSELMMNGFSKIKEKRKELDAERKLDAKGKSEIVLLEILIEMHYRGIEFLGVDVYKSAATEFIIEDGKIRIPLIAINGLGAKVVENMVREREKPFISFEDLRRRTKA